MLQVNVEQSLTSPHDPALITPDGSIGIRYVEKVGLNVSLRIWELGPGLWQKVRIASIVFDPRGDDVAGECVFIRNDQLTTVSLSKWSLRDD